MILGRRNTMRFRLPKNFTCKHCVLHFYYASADRCNPPGVLDYFHGPDRPKRWGTCTGGGGAIGGFSVNGPCTSKGKFSEEYYNCADIEIRPPGGWPAQVARQALVQSTNMTSGSSRTTGAATLRHR